MLQNAEDGGLSDSVGLLSEDPAQVRRPARCT